MNSETLRREKTLYYHMKELWEKRVLTTWEWDAFVRMYNSYEKLVLKSLEGRKK